MRVRAAMVGIGLVVLAFQASGASAQSANPRFGKWKLKSDAAPPSSNIMTYEPYQGTGMRITIESVNARGEKSQWGYTTMFDGRDEPVHGNPNTDTGAVRQINDRVNEIIYKKNGVVTQVGYDGSYGNKTVVRLEDGTEIWYCHQTSYAVSVGDTVTGGQTIGYVGSTGNTTGPHLHLEVHPGAGDAVDPYAALVAHGLIP